jgi:hypothetical protein
MGKKHLLLRRRQLFDRGFDRGERAHPSDDPRTPVERKRLADATPSTTRVGTAED